MMSNAVCSDRQQGNQPVVITCVVCIHPSLIRCSSPPSPSSPPSSFILSCCWTNRIISMYAERVRDCSITDCMCMTVISKRCCLLMATCAAAVSVTASATLYYRYLFCKRCMHENVICIGCNNWDELTESNWYFNYGTQSSIKKFL